MTDGDAAAATSFSQIDETSRQFLGVVMRQMGFSAREDHRVVRLALTIADLTGADRIQTAHIHGRIRQSWRKLPIAMQGKL